MLSHDRGFILVVVLWLIGIIAVAAAGFRSSTQTTVQLASNLSENARAEAFADAGAELAFLDILESTADPARPRRFPTDGRAVDCTIGGEAHVIISVRDVSGLVDINTAGLPLLEALIAGAGLSSRASEIAGAIYDFKDQDDNARQGGGEREAYERAGLQWAPRNAPFSSVYELEQVLGVDATLVERLRRFVTVQSGQPGIDPSSADPELLEMLRRGIRGRAFAVSAFPEPSDRTQLPAIFISPPQGRIFAVTSDANTNKGSRFVRVAELDTVSRRQVVRKLNTWRRELGASATSKPDGQAPPC